MPRCLRSWLHDQPAARAPHPDVAAVHAPPRAVPGTPWTRPHGERRLAHVVRQVAHATVFSRAFLFGVAVSLLVGCSSVPIPPTYTEDELKVICERHNGWWHPDE